MRLLDSGLYPGALAAGRQSAGRSLPKKNGARNARERARYGCIFSPAAELVPGKRTGKFRSRERRADPGRLGKKQHLGRRLRRRDDQIKKLEKPRSITASASRSDTEPNGRDRLSAVARAGGNKRPGNVADHEESKSGGKPGFTGRLDSARPVFQDIRPEKTVPARETGKYSKRKGPCRDRTGT